MITLSQQLILGLLRLALRNEIVTLFATMLALGQARTKIREAFMTVKKVMMAFARLSEKGQTQNVSIEEILAHDETGHLARLPKDKLVPLLSIGATKSGWGRSPRTRSYSKY